MCLPLRLINISRRRLLARSVLGIALVEAGIEVVCLRDCESGDCGGCGQERGEEEGGEGRHGDGLYGSDRVRIEVLIGLSIAWWSDAAGTRCLKRSRPDHERTV